MTISDLIASLEDFISTDAQILEINGSQINKSLAQVLIAYYRASESQASWFLEEIDILRGYIDHLQCDLADLQNFSFESDDVDEELFYKSEDPNSGYLS